MGGMTKGSNSIDKFWFIWSIKQEGNSLITNYNSNISSFLAGNFLPVVILLCCFVWNFWQGRTKHPLKDKKNHITSELLIKSIFIEVHCSPITFWNLNFLNYNILKFRNILLLNIEILFSFLHAQERLVKY